MQLWTAAAAVSLLAISGLLLSAEGYKHPTHGDLGGLGQSCLADLNNIFNSRYLLTSTAPSQDSRSQPWFVNAQRRLGCRLTILEALEASTDTDCPGEDQLINCFWIGHNDWVTFVNKCELFKSQVPLPACSDAPGEAAEGVPSCNAAQTASLSGRRRLLQGPANDVGIATWAYSNGEAVGLQYDSFAPTGSPYAQPPVNTQGLTGSAAAALKIAAEGSEGASVSAGSSILSNSGCFPSFWAGTDFESWLNGTYTEPARPNDFGGVNVIGLVSVLIYTVGLSALAAF